MPDGSPPDSPDPPSGSHVDSPYEFAPRTDAPKPGAPSPAAPAATPGTPAPDVEVERNCPHCGFRIVGKPRRNRCPECAAPLDEVAADLLQFADRDWLVRLSNGALLIAASIVPHVVGAVLISLKLPAGNLLHAIAGIGVALGIWMATAAEPGTPPPAAGAHFAAPARIAAIVAAVLWLLPVLGGKLADSGVFTLIILLATAAEALLIIPHLRRLPPRIPNDSLGRQIVSAGVFTAGICVALGVLQAAGMISKEYLMLLFFFVLPMIVLMGLILLWAMATLVRLAAELRNCAVAGENIVARQAQRAQAAEARRRSQ